ncbi:K(lysine) acetyltransferase [Actinomortierella ambigua]|nr:K(lysine) acetyltransferase [Actinomortierella ambigua]
MTRGDETIEIGATYWVAGRDLREYKAEVLGRRVSDLGVDLYIHYIGEDKRLDEWVDPKRIRRRVVTEVPQSEDSQEAKTEDQPTSKNKRKYVKDEVTLLTEASNSRSRRASGPGKDGADSQQGDKEDVDDGPRVRNVENILYAGYEIGTWYYSPFPDEYHDCQRLFICEFCLKYIKHVDNFIAHTRSCKSKKPPGTVVFSKGANKIYKVDGRTHKLYCQNLSLLAKLFLDNKTLYFDVHGFTFFVLTEVRASDRADVPVGFFSKEIISYDGYNLACILVLPPFQCKNYGKLLIEFSYELSRFEGKVGSPEKPLSDLGRRGYLSFWKTAILRELYPRPWPQWVSPMARYRRPRKGDVAQKDSEGDNNNGGNKQRKEDDQLEIAFSIREMAARTGIMEDDLVETLVEMGFMNQWLPIEKQNEAAPVPQARKRHRRLVRYHEQLQQGDHFSPSSSQQQLSSQEASHDHSHSSHSSKRSGSSRRLSTTQTSDTPYWPTLLTPTEEGAKMHADLLESIVDIQSSDDDSVSDEEMEDVSAPRTKISRAGASGSSLLPQQQPLSQVAVVTLDMVKEYQKEYNIRLTPYLDPTAIDWEAYRKSLE